jgi:2',3'-cyclic-nucleotide 2'-phosphodiesterase (5'-nucleotidase family)
MKILHRYERITKLISDTFLFRAVLPWTFVILLDLGIYELFIPDGRSPISSFFQLHEDHQPYVLFGLAAWIGAVALFFDSVADRIVDWRRAAAETIRVGWSEDQLSFGLKSWWAETKLRPGEVAEALKAKIGATRTSTLRNANLAAGLAISLLLATLGLRAYQENVLVSSTIVSAIWALMAGSFYLAWRELANLIALDRLVELNKLPLNPDTPTSRTTIHQSFLGLVLARMAILVLLLFLLLVPNFYLYSAQNFPQDRSEGRHLTIIAVNDVYRLDGVAKGTQGGLGRLRSLRAKIERESKQARDVVLLHAGDFLSPSMLGTVFKGRQMIDIMNRLDGDDKRFDDRMFVAFGNHEFDDSKCKNAASVLDARVAQSQFTWLNSSLDFFDCEMLSSISWQSNVRDGVVVNVAGIRLGLFGIGLTPEGMERSPASDYPKYLDEIEAAAKSVRYLRDVKGANFVVAVTHLPRETDQELLNELGSKGLDLIVGGHDHDCMELVASDGSAYGVKADSDAKTAWRIDVDLPAFGKPHIKQRRVIKLDDQSIAPDHEIKHRSDEWIRRAEEEICLKRRKSVDPNCLNEVVGSTQTDMDLDESANRTQETGFGDWIADTIYTHAKGNDTTSAYVAILNSGALGLDETIPAGSSLQLRQILDIFRFDSPVVVRSFPAKAVCKALIHGFSVPGRGAWPHVSGVKVEIQGGVPKVIEFTDRPGKVDCESTEEIKVAALPYSLCGGDGYGFKPSDKIPEGSSCVDALGSSAKETDLLSEIALKAIRETAGGIKPEKAGRVRMPPREAAPLPPAVCRGEKP